MIKQISIFKKLIAACTLLLLVQKTNAQSNRHKDTMLVIALVDSAYKYNDVDFKKALYYGDSALRFAKQINNIYGVILAYDVLADSYWFHSDFINAQKYYFRSYKLNDSLGYKKGKAVSLYNIGWVVCIQQHHHNEIHYLYEALKLRQELNEPGNTVNVLGALGSCYSDKYAYSNNKSDFDSALKYYNIVIDLGKKNEVDKRSMAVTYCNIGELFTSAKDHRSALFYTDKALDILKIVEDSAAIINCLSNKAASYIDLKMFKEAKDLSDFVYAYAIKNDLREFQMKSMHTLAKAYEHFGEYQKANEALALYIDLKEATDREAYSNELQQLQSNDEINKREADLKQSRQENEIQELKNKKKSIYISILIGIGVVILIFAYLLFKQNKVRQATNLKLQEQNKIISEKKLEIEQSIEYAKGIQTAFLPEKEKLDALIQGNFIFYKPKDVVSGDFYWFIASEEKQELLLACADCTGHGVPGALMSMVGINTLEQLSAEQKISSPGELLKHLNNDVKDSLKQNSEQNVRRDGMDIALIHLDVKHKKLVFASANRPLYIVRNKEVLEYKATKHAIGGFTNYDQVFEETELQLHKGDLVCLTSDGFADQFGGPDGKKFMTKKLKELLSTIAHLNSQEQLQEIEKAFNGWKGHHSQVDDVCVIGINI